MDMIQVKIEQMQGLDEEKVQMRIGGGVNVNFNLVS